MASESERRRVAVEAARLLYRREFEEYYHAKREAARRLGTTSLPTNREVHEELQRVAEALEGEGRGERLSALRRVAVEYMRLLRDHHPRLIGSVLTGHVREGSDVDLHLYTDDPLGVYDALDEAGIAYEMETVVRRKDEQEFTHVHVADARGCKVEMTLYPHERLHGSPRSGFTGDVLQRAPLEEVAGLLGEPEDRRGAGS